MPLYRDGTKATAEPLLARKKMNNEIENIELISKYLLDQEILWLMTPPFVYDIKSNTYWLEEDQGTMSLNETWKAELLIHLKESGDKIVLGLNQKWHEEKSIHYLLYSLKFKVNEQLRVSENRTKYSLTNLISNLKFQISGIEIWNRKENMVNSFIKDNVIRADTIVLKSNDNRQIIIQSMESIDQENCLKMKISTLTDEEFELEKKYELELISKIENPASNI